MSLLYQEPKATGRSWNTAYLCQSVEVAPLLSLPRLRPYQELRPLPLKLRPLWHAVNNYLARLLLKTAIMTRIPFSSHQSYWRKRNYRSKANKWAWLRPKLQHCLLYRPNSLTSHQVKIKAIPTLWSNLQSTWKALRPRPPHPTAKHYQLFTKELRLLLHHPRLLLRLHRHLHRHPFLSPIQVQQRPRPHPQSAKTTNLVPWPQWPSASKSYKVSNWEKPRSSVRLCQPPSQVITNVKKWKLPNTIDIFVGFPSGGGGNPITNSGTGGFKEAKNDLIAELKLSHTVGGISKLKTKQQELQEEQEREQYKRFLAQFTMENFLEKASVIR